MPALTAYQSDLDYSYAPGEFPAMECLLHRPESVRRLLLHSKAEGRPGAEKLRALADSLGIRTEIADKALSRISGKENCFAAAVFSKFSDPADAHKPHVVLHHPSDAGNVGTILRTALGFGVEDVILIRPCADPFDPKTVRASMGSLFSLRVSLYESFDAYRQAYPEHACYPFMLDGSLSLPDLLHQGIPSCWTLIFGNEGSGLPPEFASIGQPVRIPSNDRVDSLNLSIAAAIGIYGFTQEGQSCAGSIS